MELIWIPISVGAALMQAVRTAGQKSLNARLSTMIVTYVRSIFGMPVLLVYLWAVQHATDAPLPHFHAVFFLHSFAASVAQVIGTILLIQLFTLRNFAVGSTLIKTDVMMTAVIGSIFFSEVISGLGWVALALTLGGVLLLTIARTGLRGFIVASDATVPGIRSTMVGLASALAFTFSYLFLREAALSLETGDAFMRAACTAISVTGIQVLFLGVWLLWRDPRGLLSMFPEWRLCCFIGLTSALGSIGWFTAMTMENASYVRAVGQVEAIFTLLISHYYFREDMNLSEFLGIGVIVVGVLLFLL